MARHSSPRHPAAQRTLIALATVGAALGAGAAAAHADAGPRLVQVPSAPPLLGNVDPQAGLAATAGAVGHVTGPVAGLKPNPLAGTGVDPLDNGVGTQVADFKPVGSRMLTAPVAEADSLGALPVAGPPLGALGR
ncbi:hypothetical protein [Streptomyces naphthomycinicus]|uniref:hypothetical protein n=1 Tax=Streptomyces naphthomycinicus TaxID=2872625 RepID=UPI001CEDA18E|nr:hypothetical protein [Streptomyces sp. TML10]